MSLLVALGQLSLQLFDLLHNWRLVRSKDTQKVCSPNRGKDSLELMLAFSLAILSLQHIP
jgi:hypothetical protein